MNPFLSHLAPATGPHELADAKANLYGETTVRAQFRALLDAAGNVPGTELMVTYLKNDGSVRVMRCRSNGPGSDRTRRYVTVWDTDKQDYRRVALDTILSLTITAALPAE